MCPALEYTRLYTNGVEEGQHQGDEPFVLRVLAEEAVEPPQDLAEVGAGLGERPEVGARLGHEQRRAEPVAADVADRDADATVREGDEIVVVAAGVVGGEGGPGQVEALDLRRPDRVELLLHDPGEAHLDLALLGLLEPGDVAHHRDEVGDAAPLVAHRRDGLLGVEQLAAPPSVDEGGAVDVAGQDALPQPLVVTRLVPPRLQEARPLADRLLLRVAGGGLEGRVDVLDDGVRVRDEHGIRGLLDGHGELANDLVGPAVRRHVAEDDHAARRARPSRPAGGRC